MATVRAAAASFATLGVLPAAAEGHFTSSMGGVRGGFLSRVWLDRNIDSSPTTISFSGCTRPGANVTIRVGLYQQVLGVDPNLGTKTLCRTTGNWGRVAADDYRFKLEGSMNPTNVRSLTVRW